MQLFVVLQFFLATLSMLFTIDNVGSVAPLMVNIIAIDAPTSPFVARAIDAFAWIRPMLPRPHALTNYDSRTLDACLSKWAQLAVAHFNMFPLTPHLLGVKGDDLPLANDDLPANVDTSPHVGRFTATCVSSESHPALLGLGSSANALNTLASYSLLSNSENDGGSTHRPTIPAYPSLLLGMGWRPFFTRIFSPFPQRSWWMDNIRDIGLLCAFLVAFFLDIGTQRRWAIPKHQSQSSWAMEHIPTAASFKFDFMVPLVIQPRTPLEKPDSSVGRNNICSEAVIMDTTVTALQGNSLIETAGEANVGEAEVITETIVDVGRTNAVAQVLIMLAMIMVSIEHERIDNPFQHAATASKVEEITEHTIFVNSDSRNWNESSSTCFVPVTVSPSKQPDDCDEEELERSFGSFDENIWSLPEPSIVDGLTQDSEHAHALDHVVSIDQNLFSQPDHIVVDGQAGVSVSDIEEILREFSSNTNITSDGHGEVAIFNCGDGLESFPSPNLLQNTPHLEEHFPSHGVDEGQQILGFCTPEGFQQWLGPPQGPMGDFACLPISHDNSEHTIDGFDEFLRQLSSNTNVVTEGDGTDPVFNIENITPYPLPSFLEEIPDSTQVSVPVAVAQMEHQEVPDFTSWFASAQTQKILDDLAGDFPFPLDGPDPNLEAALALAQSDLSSFVPFDDSQLQQWLGSMPESMTGFGDFAFPVHDADWSLNFPIPEHFSTSTLNVRNNHLYEADYDHFTTDELFAPESAFITVRLNGSAAPIHVSLDAGHSALDVTKSLFQGNVSIDPDVSSSSTLVQLDGEFDTEFIKAPQEDSASAIMNSSASYAPVPVVDFHDKAVFRSELAEPSTNYGLAASIYAPRPASNTVPVVDVSAVLEREQTCHYVVHGVETYEEVKAKSDLYDLFVALVMQKGEVQGVSASIHAVKELLPEGAAPANTASSAVDGERTSRGSFGVPVTAREKERQIPAVAQDVSKPVQERQTPKDRSIYASMWATCPAEPIVPQPSASRRKDIPVRPKLSKAPLDSDRSTNASIWVSCSTKHMAPRSTTPLTKCADTYVPKVSKATQDRDIYASVYADRPKNPVSPKPKSSFRFSSTQAGNELGKNPTSGWTREEFEGAQILLGLSGSR